MVLLGASPPRLTAAPGFHFVGQPGTHSLYVLNEDGNLFRWGEKRHGDNASSPWPARVPYYEAVVTVPPSPSGARWQLAAGFQELEVLLDEAGHVYLNVLSMTAPTRLVELVHPNPYRSWRWMANSGGSGLLVDDVGALYRAEVWQAFHHLRANPGAPLPVAHSWVTLVPPPSPDDPIQQAEVVGSGSILALAASGELHGRGYSFAGLTGGEFAHNDWQRVVRPDGVAGWQSFKASAVAAVAWSGAGEVYYWGQRIGGSSFADHGTNERIPVRIPKPAGVTGWVSADVTGGLVFLVSQEGGLFVLGSGFPFLQWPATGTAGGQLTKPTPVNHPELAGEFASVHCGADYVIARKRDGSDVRWGKFMRLQDGTTADTPPGLMEVPAAITDAFLRRAPAARVLNPENFAQVRVGGSASLQAEVFPLEGTLSSVQFLLNNSPLAGAVELAGNLATLTWQPQWPGDHSLLVRAVDSAGRVTTAPAVTFQTRHSVEWTLSTNRISEPGDHDQVTAAVLSLTRTELPYPNYHEFTYRFNVGPASQRDLDYAITGATLAEDGSGEWEVVFPRGQKTAAVTIAALPDQFTESALAVVIVPSYHWARARDYLPPAANLELHIVDTTFTGGPSPVTILAEPAARFSFRGATVPLTVSVPKSLTTTPVVQLLGLFQNQYQHVHSEELPDRRLVHFEVRYLEAGLHQVRARVQAAATWGHYRYRDSQPVALQVWDPAELPTVRVVAGEQVVDEGDAPPVTVTVMRDGPLADPVTVNLNIRGMAINGGDYAALPTAVVIPAGAGYTTLTVQVRDDHHPELEEMVIISAIQDPCLELAGCYFADVNSTARITIRDDDRVVEAPAVGARVVASPYADGSYLLTASGQLYGWGDNEGGRLGLGELPVELADQVPWPRRLRVPGGSGQWSELFAGENQAFGRTRTGELFAWGAGFANALGPFSLNSPWPVWPLPTDFRPWFVHAGALVTPQASGHLLVRRLSSYSPLQFYGHGNPGMRGLLFTAQNRVLGEAGFFHPAGDIAGLYPERYPLAPGAGYWVDAASAGDQLVALDELGRLFDVRRAGFVFDPALQRTLHAYATTARPPLPDQRAVTQLLGNELAVLALAADGTAFTLQAGGGQPVIPFPKGVTRWTSLAAGARHFLAVGDDGHVYAWGENLAGQLGDGTREPADLPRRVPAFTGVNDPTIESPIVDLALPPVVQIHELSGPIEMDGPALLPAAARAFDPDGVIDRVEFLVNGELAAVAVFDPQTRTFRAAVPILQPGDHLLTARAWDDSGLFGDSAPLPVWVDDPGRYPIVKVWNLPSGTAEGYGVPAYFIISRQGIAQVPLTVYFDIHGTATEGEDYPALPRHVTIPAGAAEVRIPIIARPDFVDEDTEVINLTILNPGCDPDTAEPGSGCYRIGTPHTAPVFILDYLRPGDALLPFVSLAVLEPIAREGTTNIARIEVRRTGPRGEDLSVPYQLGGTAQNGLDYAPLSGIAVIPAGADRTFINIVAIQDFVVEPFESVVVSIRNPGCDVGAGSAAGCFLSDVENVVVAYIGDKPVLPPPPPGLPGLNVTPRPVYFSGLELLPRQGTMLSLVSDPGVRFTLQVSSDLRAWRDLGELTCVSGHMDFLDVDAAQAPARYYRVVAAPEP